MRHGEGKIAFGDAGYRGVDKRTDVNALPDAFKQQSAINQPCDVYEIT